MLYRFLRWLLYRPKPRPAYIKPEPQLLEALNVLREVLCFTEVLSTTPTAIEIRTAAGAELTLTLEEGRVTAYGIDTKAQFAICGVYFVGSGWQFSRQWIPAKRYYTKMK